MFGLQCSVEPNQWHHAARYFHANPLGRRKNPTVAEEELDDLRRSKRSSLRLSEPADSAALAPPSCP